VVFDSPNLDSVERCLKSIPTDDSRHSHSTAGHFDLHGQVDCRLAVRCRLGAINYVDRKGILTVPTLVFHGANDQTIPLSVSGDLSCTRIW
jgi:hypothetical protein